MTLEILNNRAEHTHENEQFRRVISIIENTFEKLDYNGLLIGNPFNESFSRFRADAVLLYNNGLVIIDFKDYRGKIKLPPNVDEFKNTVWHNESKKNPRSLEIKAGSRFINPFRQLEAYRNAFNNEIAVRYQLKSFIDTTKVVIVNIFSGPVEIINEVPKNLPYYKLIQESGLGEFLYDFASPNRFSTEVAEKLKHIFPAEEWIRSFDSIKLEHVQENDKIIEIEENVEQEINDFLKENSGGILILESMNTKDRDNWMTYLWQQAINYNIPQVDAWSHSARISRKIFNRSNIPTYSIYSEIYGGSHKTEADNEKKQEEGADAEENLLEVIPLRSSESIDKKALIIVHEAHMISRSLHQSDLLRFGSGRLLEDIISFLNPKGDRKIVFIGDPYSLSYGKNEDSALNINTLSNLYSQRIKHYRKPIKLDYSNNKEKLITELADSIENKLFNNLNYSFDDQYLKEIYSDEVQKKLQEWFSKPLVDEPTKAVLFYSKKDYHKTNLWIKKKCLNNGEKLDQGDLIIANNNVNLPDETGFQSPRKIVNGMFFSVLQVKENKIHTIPIKQAPKPISLTFVRLRVKSLSIANLPETDFWILENYFLSEDGLSKEEKIAFRVFVNKKIDEEKKKQKFTASTQCNRMLEDKRYKELSDEEKKAIEKLIENYGLPKDKENKVNTTKNARDILGEYNKLYTRNIFIQIRETDPFVNAVFVRYGWAITVHKSLGSSYEEVILKGFRKENDGITNDSYFRWLYSGVSSSDRKVSIVSPQRINPLMNCIFEDNANIGAINEGKQEKREKSLLFFENYSVESRFSDKIKGIENVNVLGTICEISKKIEQKGYLLESVKKFTDYLTKAFYSVPNTTNRQLILNIDNKGAKDNWAVGNIRIEKTDATNGEYIAQSIQDVLRPKQISTENNAKNIELPTDFREKIYARWFAQLEENSCSAKIVQSHNNQDVFLVKKGTEKVKFRAWYGTSEQNHTKGFFSKLEILEKNSEELVREIKNLLPR